MGGCEPPCGCWDLNPGLSEQQSYQLSHFAILPAPCFLFLFVLYFLSLKLSGKTKVLFFFFFLMFMNVLSACMFVYHVHSWCPQKSEGVGSPAARVIENCELPCRCLGQPRSSAKAANAFHLWVNVCPVHTSVQSMSEFLKREIGVSLIAALTLFSTQCYIEHRLYN